MQPPLLSHHLLLTRLALRTLLPRRTFDPSEDKPARAIAEAICDLLFQMQMEDGDSSSSYMGGRPGATPAPNWTADALESHAHVLDSCINLTSLSRNMCLNFEANGAVRATMPYLRTGFGAARLKALSFLVNLCTHTHMSCKTLTALGADKIIMHLLPSLVASELIMRASCCDERWQQVQKERVLALRLLFMINGISDEWLKNQNQHKEEMAEEKELAIARGFLHKVRNRQGASSRCVPLSPHSVHPLFSSPICLLCTPCIWHLLSLLRAPSHPPPPPPPPPFRWCPLRHPSP